MIRPDDEPRRRWLQSGNSTVRSAQITALGVVGAALVTITGQIVVAVITASSISAKPPLAPVATPLVIESCEIVSERFQQRALQNPSLTRALLEPGPDGASAIAGNPDAQRCGIDDANVRLMLPPGS